MPRTDRRGWRAEQRASRASLRDVNSEREPATTTQHSGATPVRYVQTEDRAVEPIQARASPSGARQRGQLCEDLELLAPLGPCPPPAIDPESHCLERQSPPQQHLPPGVPLALKRPTLHHCNRPPTSPCAHAYSACNTLTAQHTTFTTPLPRPALAMPSPADPPDAAVDVSPPTANSPPPSPSSRQSPSVSSDDDDDDYDDTYGVARAAASEAKRPVFFPPLWLARRSECIQLLQSEGVRSVRASLSSWRSLSVR